LHPFGPLKPQIRAELGDSSGSSRMGKPRWSG
jgi:hypothetical protein